MNSWIRRRLGPPKATITLGNKSKGFASPEWLQKVTGKEDSLLFTFLVLLSHDYIPSNCRKDIRKTQDKEQHFWQKEWWDLPMEKSKDD